MEWVKTDEGWELKAYYNAITVCKLTKDKDGDWEIKSQWREEFLGNMADDEAKEEALEIMTSTLEGEKDYFDELIAEIKELQGESE